MQASKLHNERLVDKVYAVLRTAILKGELLGGSPLSVPELSRQLGVSRSPVREAVLQLVADGLATEVAHKGAVVASFGLEEALQVYEVREAVESAAVYWAAQRRTAADLQALEGVMAAQQQAVAQNDLERYETSDLEFHKQLGSASHNPVLERAVSVYKDQTYLALDSARRSLAQMETGLKEHGRIVRAIEAGDSAAAEQALREHFQRIKRSLEAWLRHQ